MATPLTGRDDFTAGQLTTLEDGGQIGWLIKIDANTNDLATANGSWPVDVASFSFSNLSTSTWAEANLKTAKLLTTGRIGITGNLFDNPIAEVAKMTFTIENLTGFYDDLRCLGVNFNGRKVTVYIVFDTQVVEANSVAVLTGVITEATPQKFRVRFSILGKSFFRNKEIGEQVNEFALERFRGKIFPITYGDWTDENAWAPTIVENVYRKIPDFVMDTQKWKRFDAIYGYDEDVNRGYRAGNVEGTDFSINASKNRIRGFLDTTAELFGTIGKTNTVFPVKNLDQLTYHTSSSSAIPAATIIKIRDELMLVTKPFKFNTATFGEVTVERGFADTIPAIHGPISVGAAGPSISQATAEAGKILVKLSGVFYAKSFSGARVDFVDGEFNAVTDFPVKINGGNFIDLAKTEEIDSGLFLKMEVRKSFSDGGLRFWFDLIFEKIGIPGTIIKQFLILDCRAISERIDSGVSATLSVAIRLMRDHNSAVFLAPASVIQTTTTATTVVDDFNNTATGVDLETDFDLSTVSIEIADASDLSNTAYQIAFRAEKTGGLATCVFTWELNRVGMRVDWEVSPDDVDFFAKGLGRENPGGYFNGASPDLLENPSSVIEDFLRTEIEGTSASDLTETFFDIAFTDRTSWKLAYSVFGNPKKSKDVLKEICVNGSLLMHERFDGTIAITSLDVEDSPTLLLDNDYIKLSGENTPDFEVGYTSSSKLITGININYKTIIPERDEYGAVKFARWNPTDGKLDHNFTGVAFQSEYSAKLEKAFNEIDETREITIKANAIRDSGTAELLARQIIDFRHRQLARVKIRCTYLAIRFEMWNKIELTATLFPLHLLTKTWIVEGIDIVPNVNSVEPEVILSLLQMPKNGDYHSAEPNHNVLWPLMQLP